MQIGGSYRDNIGTGVIVDGIAFVNYVSMMIHQLSYASGMRPLTLQRVFWWLRSKQSPVRDCAAGDCVFFPVRLGS
jgi:hypothetical protein